MHYAAIELPVVGFFTWDLSTNNLIADEVYADIYGFNHADVVAGVTIEQVIARILPADREKAARDTHLAITSGRFVSTSFRVEKNGIIRDVVSFGRCLRNVDGVPHIYTGGLRYIVEPYRGLEAVPLKRH